jgi:hypothetical protein
LEYLPESDRRKVIAAINGLPDFKGLVPSAVHEALEHHVRTGIPLRLALEAKVGFGSEAVRNPLVVEMLERLRPSFRLHSLGGAVQVRPSLAIRTQATNKGYGLNNFTSVAFRVFPFQTEMKSFQKAGVHHWNLQGPLAYLQLFEFGFARVGKRPVVIVTNAQADREYYSLPWKLKKMFKGSYEAVLEEVQRASDGLPVLIPSNKTVREMLAKALKHTAPAHVLDEFYDRFSEKRGRHKAVITLKNPVDGKSVTAEFWIK